MSDQPAPRPEERRRVDRGGYALRCALAGGGQPTFLCLHGLVDTLEIWDRLVEPLAERGRVVRLDQRGHGESQAPPGPCTREDLAADAVGVLDALGIERAILVGHSLGGIVAMTAALARPTRVAGLVLLGTASHCSERVAAWYERIARAGEQEGLDGLARAIYGAAPRPRVRGDARAIAQVTRALKSLHGDPLTPRLAQVACPTLLLVGANDPLGPKASEIVLRALPPGRGRLEVIAERGHWLHVEAPGAVVEALDRWRASAVGRAATLGSHA
jgi:3-oxoadipate enol-lactonase